MSDYCKELSETFNITFHEKGARWVLENGVFKYKFMGEKKFNCSIEERLPENLCTLFNEYNGFKIYFACTLFSLLKPLFKHCRLPVDFYVNIHNIDGKLNTDDFFDFYRQQAYFICNPRNGSNIDNMDESLNKHFEFTSHRAFKFETHKNFPSVFQKYNFSKNKKKESKKFSPVSCKSILASENLAIFISPEGDSCCVTNEANCLTININSIPRYDGSIYNASVRNAIMGFYSDFLRYISEDSSFIITNVKPCFEKQLKILGTKRANATSAQKQVAIMLTTLKLASEFAEWKKGEMEKKELRTNFIWISIIDSCKNLFKTFADKKVAERSDFAAFISCCIEKKDKVIYNTGEEKSEYIYLHYKEYWDSFKKYCDSNDIIVNTSKGGFCRENLKEYIKLQYQPTPTGTRHYDYIKTINGQKTRVLAINRSILKCAKTHETK